MKPVYKLLTTYGERHFLSKLGIEMQYIGHLSVAIFPLNNKFMRFLPSEVQ